MRSSFTKACNELFSSGKFSDYNIPFELSHKATIDLNKFDLNKKSETNEARIPQVINKLKNVR